MHTTLTKYHEIGKVTPAGKGNTGSNRTLEYLSLGQRKSNNIFVRIYNKGLEVVEKGYKGLFFDLWYKNGLISFYDKYCYEYAYTHKDFNALDEAKLYFYLEHGKDEAVKREFKLTLSDSKTTHLQIKELASQYMPKVTTVINIEFQTKRKFYYYSDEFIEDSLQPHPRDNCPSPLNRIFRIIDNRAVFLDYLTSTTLNFSKNGKYVDWWKRLRGTRLESVSTDAALLRDYSYALDDKLVKVNFINSVASNAVYSDNISSDFIEDVSDILSVMNDNDKVSFKAYINDLEFQEAWEKEHGISIETVSSFYSFNGQYLSNYITKKVRKDRRLKNRKNNRGGDL